MTKFVSIPNPTYPNLLNLSWEFIPIPYSINGWLDHLKTKIIMHRFKTWSQDSISSKTIGYSIHFLYSILQNHNFVHKIAPLQVMFVQVTIQALEMSWRRFTYNPSFILPLTTQLVLSSKLCKKFLCNFAKIAKLSMSNFLTTFAILQVETSKLSNLISNLPKWI